MTDKEQSEPTKPRVISLHDDITSETAGSVIEKLLKLADEADDDITLVICSPGGSVYDAFAIIDIMTAIKPDVRTIVAGWGASAGHLIAVYGTPGKRFILPNAYMMMHKIWSSTHGTVNEMQVDMIQTKKLQDHFVKLISDRSKLTKSDIVKLIEKDLWCSARMCVQYGFVDGIIKIIKP